MKNIQRNKTGTTKKCKWNNDCIMRGFYRTEKEMLYPFLLPVVRFALPSLETLT